ncbi:Plant UBX domain-containing protein 1 [Castilleja foliolosa]|uniref:Plant UBX domain-containing protein 1 n=1 Tax=Castilleja foliolosa TaxID=1961234 RepID=A0ABD3BTP5_9LAMI
MEGNFKNRLWPERERERASLVENYGRPFQVFESSYSDDYSWILATKEEEKIRADARAVIRVRFPDNHTLEVIFHPLKTIQILVNLLNKVIARPKVPFHLFTTPPNKPKKQLKDLYCVGLVHGCIVYFASDMPKGDGDAPFAGFLKEDVTSLKLLNYPSPFPNPHTI